MKQQGKDIVASAESMGQLRAAVPLSKSTVIQKER